MSNNGKTLESHEHVCSWCEKEFSSCIRGQLIAKRAGKNVYCSSACGYAMESSRPKPLRGPCKICGKMFRAAGKNRKYCSQKCYTSSPECVERLRASNADKQDQSRKCAVCEKQLRARQVRCCSKQCARQYFAERFDRFVANPETIALPQNFDEFLAKKKLPCLVDGCDWIGVRLGQHVNWMHGITADKFRELVGFNKTSGLIGIEGSRKASEIARRLVEEGKCGVAFKAYLERQKTGEIPRTQSGPGDRLEASEKRRKAQAIIRAVLTENTCEYCGKPYQIAKVSSKTSRFCSVRCRSQRDRVARAREVAELICSFCGGHFMGNAFKVQRANKQLPVTCSDDCRNKMNMRACLASQGRRMPSD